MDEDGDKDGKTSGAVEKIAEGEVEKEDRDVVAQPRELFPVPLKIGGHSKFQFRALVHPTLSSRREWQSESKDFQECRQ